MSGGNYTPLHFKYSPFTDGKYGSYFTVQDALLECESKQSMQTEERGILVTVTSVLNGWMMIIVTEFLPFFFDLNTQMPLQRSSSSAVRWLDYRWFIYDGWCCCLSRFRSWSFDLRVLSLVEQRAEFVNTFWTIYVLPHFLCMLISGSNN